MSKPEATIKAPENPNLLRLSQAIRDVDRRTKGSPANLLVPTSLGTMLNRWGYGEGTTAGEKLFAAADVGTPSASPADLAPLLSIFIKPDRVKDAAKIAKALSMKGNAADIWRETGIGWHPTSSDMLKEIDDSGAKMVARPGANTDLPLDMVIDHPELFNEVPEARNITIKSYKDQAVGGGYWPSANMIEMGKKLPPEEFMDTGVHEIEHAMQKQFGLPKGGNARQFGYDTHTKEIVKQAKELTAGLRAMKGTGQLDNAEYSALVERMNSAPDDTVRLDVDEVLNMLPNTVNPPARRVMTNALTKWDAAKADRAVSVDNYRNITGEGMARLTEARRKLTAGERLEDYPFDPSYFKRLTGTDISDLREAPVKGSGVQSAVNEAIGPVYRGATTPERLDNLNWFTKDSAFADDFAMGRAADEAPFPYPEGATMGKYELPDEGHIDFAKNKSLADELRAWQDSRGDFYKGKDIFTGDDINWLGDDAFRKFADETNLPWSSLKVHEGGEGDALFSYLAKDPAVVKSLIGTKK